MISDQTPNESAHATEFPRMGVPTNADLAVHAEEGTAYDVVRAWLERHVPDRFDNSREDKRVWLDWAAQNFLADPEIRQHLAVVVSPTS
jgi:hypothetical protein